MDDLPESVIEEAANIARKGWCRICGTRIEGGIFVVGSDNALYHDNCYESEWRRQLERR